LSDTRICQGKLGNGITGDGKLADADHPDTELRNIDNTCTELAVASNSRMYPF
jgi:hypothetical protein